ncbi:MAG: tRNA pseudouridine(38-40) synthase TruA [Tannerellaceae bacterium]|nr:tRNA pseudouridine(38-40) synthase TruA [Tannerellaceae bacterium]
MLRGDFSYLCNYKIIILNQFNVNRYFIYLAYNGKNYCGWQNQPNGTSVQQTLEEGLGTLLRVPVAVTGAGRTDAGVHARLMVAHFDCPEFLNDPDALTEKLNRILPCDIAIYRIIQVRPEAHARFDAVSRTYKYYILQRKDPFLCDFSYRVRGVLDIESMNIASRLLLGYNDFTSFSKLHTDVKTNICRVSHAEFTLEDGQLCFTITADRFLRNMVRAIVGTLLDVGRGKLSLEDFRQVIEEKDRGKAGTSVPGHALFLTDVTYPEEVFDVSW